MSGERKHEQRCEFWTTVKEFFKIFFIISQLERKMSNDIGNK